MRCLVTRMASPLLVWGAAVPSAILSASSRSRGFLATADDEEFVSAGFYVCSVADADGCGIFATNGDIAHVGAVAVSLDDLGDLYAACEGITDAAVASTDPIMGARLTAAVVAGLG